MVTYPGWAVCAAAAIAAAAAACAAPCRSGCESGDGTTPLDVLCFDSRLSGVGTGDAVL